MAIRFIFALHNHQPVGNFDGVFEQAYRDSYYAFLDLFDQFPDIPVALHISGCLMEWLLQHKPEYIDRLRGLVQRGQIEILGGGFYEPILPMIPSRDRVGQIRTYSDYLQKIFPTTIRGMWIPERVWEQCLVSDIVEAGVEFTVLDDYHFRQAGLEEQQLQDGYFLTEDEGQLLRVFPNSEQMRYLVPWRDPEETVEYLRGVAQTKPDAVIVCADDGEKFGGWPGTHKLCFTDGWLARFMTAIQKEKDWIQPCTFSQIIDSKPPAGSVYLPDSSYREMTEWALPYPKLQAYNRLHQRLEQDANQDEVKRFLRGGFWRNFKVKYPETQEMYARMMEVSRRLDDAQRANGVAASALRTAEQELYRAQCNCAWWHGAFGGLYLPHLRHAIYHHLILADNELCRIRHTDGDWVELQQTDLNLDGLPEVGLANARLAAYFKPHEGGSLYELDIRGIAQNVLNTLSRRPEVYHETIIKHALGEKHHGGAGIPDEVQLKQKGLEKQIQYDPYLRKSLIDHFYAPSTKLKKMAAGQAKEIGDFVTSQYASSVSQADDQASVTLSRNGRVGNDEIFLKKTITLERGSDALVVNYVLENLPRNAKFMFAVECNIAGMASGADDRYFYHTDAERAGQLQTQQDIADASYIGLVDEWLGLDARVSADGAQGIWAFPIQTVSQSEGGFELVYQSTAVVPHWLVKPDADGRWNTTVTLTMDVSRAEARLKAAATA